MPGKTTARIVNWLGMHTRRWPFRKRLTIALVAGQAVVLGLLAVIALIITQPDLHIPDGTRVPFAIIASLLLLGSTAAIASALAGRMTRRVTDLTTRVRQQVPTGDLDFLVTTEREDELWHLVTELNHLFQAYQDSLDRLADRTDRMATINLIAATINRSFDLQDVFETSLREVLQCIGWDAGAIYLWNERASELKLAAHNGLSKDAINCMRICRSGKGVAGQAARTLQIVIAEDIREHAYVDPAAAAHMPVTLVGLPLLSEPGRLLGVLDIGNSKPVKPTEDEINLLATVAHQLALAVDKARLVATISQYAEKLENTVQERTQELQQAYREVSQALDRAKEADKVKSLLLSTVSHELRTPLATIKGNTSLLLEHHRQMPPETADEHLRDIEEETDKLTDLVSNLLDMSRIEAGVLRIQPEPLNLKDVVENAIFAAQVRLGTHKLNLDAAEQLPLALGDPRRVEQIVANLLNNAAQYSPLGFPIDVGIRSNSAELVVSVTDYGPGIAPEHLDSIFDRFYQIDPGGDSHRGGIGLGLSICRGLVEAHRGKLWVNSKVGMGSTFSFSLPRYPPQ